jgi:hypothetical protein
MSKQSEKKGLYADVTQSQEVRALLLSRPEYAHPWNNTTGLERPGIQPLFSTSRVRYFVG